MTVCRIPVVLVTGLALLVGCSSATGAGAGASRGKRVFIPGFGYMEAGGARKFLHETQNGPRALALQRAAARREGIALTPKELQAPLPPPEENAATVYAELGRLLKAKPLDPRTDPVRGSLGVRVAHAPEDVERVRKLLAERQDVLELARAAVGRPRCVFGRDLARGTEVEVMLREADRMLTAYSAMRETVRLLTAESYFLAVDGHYREAVALQGRVFRVAEHAFTEPSLMDNLVGIACDAITLSGMENILSLAGPNAEVAEAVRATVAAQRPRLRLRRALEGEVVLFTASLSTIRRARTQRELMGELSAEDRREMLRAGLSPDSNRIFTPAEQRIRRGAVDVMAAHFLEQMRRLLAVVDKPYPAQKPVLKSLAQLDRSPSQNPARRLGNMLPPVFAPASAKQAQARAQEEVIMAAASVLVYRARGGAFPDRLEQALPELPKDPFSGKPLQYRREEEGFVVYSVGAEGRFDGGRSGAPRERDQAYFRYPATPQPPRQN